MRVVSEHYSCTKSFCTQRKQIVFLQDCLLPENCHQTWDFLKNLSIFDNILLGKFPKSRERGQNMAIRTRQDIRNHSRVTKSFMSVVLRYNMVNQSLGLYSEKESLKVCFLDCQRNACFARSTSGLFLYNLQKPWDNVVFPLGSKNLEQFFQ